MGARGRKSQADLAVVAVDKAQRPEPWPTLSTLEAEHWRGIVKSLPADWFRPADLPLLAAYCKAAAQLDDAYARLATEPAIETNAAGTRVPNPNYRIVDATSSQLARLATKLRLCPSSRYDKQKAATLVKQTPNAARPWNFGGKGEGPER
jgi:P27 family predicted phage terminase small subunit